MERGALKKLRALVDDGEITEAVLVAALEVFVEHAPEEWARSGPVRAVMHEWGAEGTDDELEQEATSPAQDERAPVTALRPRLSPPVLRFNVPAMTGKMSRGQIAQINRWAASSSSEDIEALERWR